MNEMSNVDVELILVDPNESLCREWQMAFAKRPGVSVVCGRFEALPEFDCMVSAANSFGLMDGGVDLAITRFFGVPLMERVQAHILRSTGRAADRNIVHYRNGSSEAPVCCAYSDDARANGDFDHRQCVHCDVGDAPCRTSTQHVVVHENPKSGMPGSRDCNGRVSPNEAARQMALAHHWYLHPLNVIDWPAVQARQAAIGRGGDLT